MFCRPQPPGGATTSGYQYILPRAAPRDYQDDHGVHYHPGRKNYTQQDAWDERGSRCSQSSIAWQEGYERGDYMNSWHVQQDRGRTHRAKRFMPLPTAPSHSSPIPTHHPQPFLPPPPLLPTPSTPSNHPLATSMNCLLPTPAHRPPTPAHRQPPMLPPRLPPEPSNHPPPMSAPHPRTLQHRSPLPIEFKNSRPSLNYGTKPHHHQPRVTPKMSVDPSLHTRQSHGYSQHSHTRPHQSYIQPKQGHISPPQYNHSPLSHQSHTRSKHKSSSHSQQSPTASKKQKRHTSPSHPLTKSPSGSIRRNQDWCSASRNTHSIKKNVKAGGNSSGDRRVPSTTPHQPGQSVVHIDAPPPPQANGRVAVTQEHHNPSPINLSKKSHRQDHITPHHPSPTLIHAGSPLTPPPTPPTTQPIHNPCFRAASEVSPRRMEGLVGVLQESSVIKTKQKATIASDQANSSKPHSKTQDSDDLVVVASFVNKVPHKKRKLHGRESQSSPKTTFMEREKSKKGKSAITSVNGKLQSLKEKLGNQEKHRSLKKHVLKQDTRKRDIVIVSSFASEAQHKRRQRSSEELPHTSKEHFLKPRISKEKLALVYKDFFNDKLPSIIKRRFLQQMAKKEKKRDMKQTEKLTEKENKDEKKREEDVKKKKEKEEDISIIASFTKTLPKKQKMCYQESTQSPKKLCLENVAFREEKKAKEVKKKDPKRIEERKRQKRKMKKRKRLEKMREEKMRQEEEEKEGKNNKMEKKEEEKEKKELEVKNKDEKEKERSEEKEEEIKKEKKKVNIIERKKSEDEREKERHSRSEEKEVEEEEERKKKEEAIKIDRKKNEEEKKEREHKNKVEEKKTKEIMWKEKKQHNMSKEGEEEEKEKENCMNEEEKAVNKKDEKNKEKENAERDKTEEEEENWRRTWTRLHKMPGDIPDDEMESFVDKLIDKLGLTLPKNHGRNQDAREAEDRMGHEGSFWDPHTQQEEEEEVIRCKGVEGCECSACFLPLKISSYFTLTQDPFMSLVKEEECEDMNDICEDDGVASSLRNNQFLPTAEEGEGGGTAKEGEGGGTAKEGEGGITTITTTTSPPFCYTCNGKEGQPQEDLGGHLYFGMVTCEFCEVGIYDCQFFRSISNPDSPLLTCSMSPTRHHVFCKWKCDPYAYLTSNIALDLIGQHIDPNTKPLSIQDMRLAVVRYIMSLEALSDKSPWRSAIEMCWRGVRKGGGGGVVVEKGKSNVEEEKEDRERRKEMEEETDCNTGLTETEKNGDEEETEEENRRQEKEELDNHKMILNTEKDQTQRTNNRVILPPLEAYHPAKEPSIINTPVNGHFLVVRYPSEKCPEECPDCYVTMCPSQCTYSLINGLVTYVCPACHLTIYLIADQNKDVVFRGYVAVAGRNSRPKSKKCSQKSWHV